MTLDALDLRAARPAAAPAPTPRHERPLRRRWSAGLSLGLTALAAVLLVVALPAIASAPESQFGLLAAGPWYYLAAILLLPVALGVAVAAGSRLAGWASVVASVAVLRLPGSAATDMPIYTWTYKHLGVVDYIQQYGTVARGVDVYHSWPGFFAGFAWINDLTGTATIDLAHWFTPVLELALSLGVYALARAFGLRPLPAIVAAFLVQVLDWVAQDYFSPQAVALLLSVAVLALLVRSRRRPVLAWVALGIYAAIVVTHQLTPYWLLCAIIALSVLGWIRPRWIALCFAAVALGFLLSNYDVIQRYGDLISLNPGANVQTNIGGVGSPGHDFAGLSGRITAGLLWGAALVIAVLTWWRRKAHRRRVLGIAAVAFSPFALLFGQGYGGEAVFRVMLYSLLGCSILVAPWIVGLLQGRRPLPLRARWRRGGARALGVLGTGALLLGATGFSAQAYFGAWSVNKIDRGAYDAMTDLLLHADTHTLLIGLAPGAPGRTVARYVDFAEYNPGFDLGVNTWFGWVGNDFRSPDTVNRATAALLAAHQPSTIFVTEQMKVYANYYGLFPDGAIDRFLQQLKDTGKWTVVEDTPTLSVLTLDVGSAP